jgi:hypothetical protein
VITNPVNPSFPSVSLRFRSDKRFSNAKPGILACLLVRNLRLTDLAEGKEACTLGLLKFWKRKRDSPPPKRSRFKSRHKCEDSISMINLILRAPEENRRKHAENAYRAAEKNEGGGYHGWGRFAAAVGFGRDSYDR